MKSKILNFAWLVGIIVITSFGNAEVCRSESTTLTPPCSKSTASENIECIQKEAKEIVVKISPKKSDAGNSGSGSLIGKKGDRYYVLTNLHVVKGTKEISKLESRGVQIKTWDGKIHDGFIDDKLISFGEYDLALVWFKSQDIYKLPVLSDTGNVKQDDTIYVAGYACQASDGCLGNYKFTQGSAYVGALNLNPLYLGYNLGYTNTVENGMSGGVVLDGNGRLIGINGKQRFIRRVLMSGNQKVPDFNPFIFMSDGREVDDNLVKKIKAHSWGIPLNVFLESINKIIGRPPDQVVSEIILNFDFSKSFKFKNDTGLNLNLNKNYIYSESIVSLNFSENFEFKNNTNLDLASSKNHDFIVNRSSLSIILIFSLVLLVASTCYIYLDSRKKFICSLYLDYNSQSLVVVVRASKSNKSLTSELLENFTWEITNYKTKDKIVKDNVSIQVIKNKRHSLSLDDTWTIKKVMIYDPIDKSLTPVNKSLKTNPIEDNADLQNANNNSTFELEFFRGEEIIVLLKHHQLSVKSKELGSLASAL